MNRKIHKTVTIAMRSYITRSYKRVEIPNVLDLKKTVEVIVSSEDDIINQWITKHIKMDEPSILGLDIEWRPSFRIQSESRTALIQIASPDSVLLARVHTKEQLPSELREILSNINCIKVGVGVLLDMKKIDQDFKTQSCGYIDIGDTVERHYNHHQSQRQQQIFQQQALLQQQQAQEGHQESSTPPAVDSAPALDEPSTPLMKTGLSSLAKELLDVEMSKSRSIQMSNWEAKELTDNQIQYAANDAFISYLVYDKLLSSGAYDKEVLVKYRNDVNIFLQQQPKVDEFGLKKEDFRKVYNLSKESDVFSIFNSNDIASLDYHVVQALHKNYRLFVQQYCTRLSWPLSFHTIQHVQSKTEHSFRVSLICNNITVGIGSGNSLKAARDDACKLFAYELIEVSRTVPGDELIQVFSGKLPVPLQYYQLLHTYSNILKDSSLQ